MRAAELQKILWNVDNAVVLVSPQILERVIRDDCKLPSIYISVPHWKSYVADRQMLYRHAEQADLELEPEQLLPETVILLSRPPAEELNREDRAQILLRSWRRLFHARIHIALGVPGEPGTLNEATIRERIEEIGRTEFEEIRAVLQEDKYLPADADDRAVYIEFAAVFLEMRFFADSLLTSYFPGICDRERIVQLLARDVDAKELFARTRLPGAPDPVAPRDNRAESEDLYQSLLGQAREQERLGNIVGAAILHMRAARIATAADTDRTRAKANANLNVLKKRLMAALNLDATEADHWYRHMTSLLEKADQGYRPSEARLLEDLQDVCIDSERDIYTLDLVEWFMSLGKRPIKRQLPSLRIVRITRHLRNAFARLGSVRLSDVDREEFSRLLQGALSRSEENVRARFRPVLIQALQDVGLEPTNPPEKAAFDKVVAELLDRIIGLGFFTFADLRDTISRNQLKLSDLRDPQEFLRGDALIRLNGRLTALLDGVYRPGEVYMRTLEWMTAWKFGTPFGRAVTSYVTIPLGGAFLILAALGFLLKEVSHYFWPHPALHAASQILLGPWHGMGGRSEVPPPVLDPPPLPEAPSEGPAALIDLSDHFVLVWHGLLLGSLAVFLFALLHSERFRHRCSLALGWTWHYMRLIAWDLPVRFVPFEALERFFNSWLFQIVWWVVLQPLAFSALLWLRWPILHHTLWSAAGTYLCLVVLINSKAGRGSAQILWELTSTISTKLHEGLLKGLLHFIIRIFKQIIDFLEFVLFTVEEWLRFRAGDSWPSMVARVILGVIWFPVAYLIRFYMVVLIEPGINPIKFPISSLAAKFVYPLIITLNLQQALVGYLDPVLGAVLANFLVGSTIWLSPDVFGFLFWEIKENWSLYKANRATNLRAVSVGPHGESLKGLLQPGFHSGTVPRVYTRLRKAERKACITGDWHYVRSLRHELEEIASAIRRFVLRELVGLLRQSHSWQGNPIEVGAVHLATNRIRFELTHPDAPTQPVVVEIERAGKRWLVASLRETGWLTRLGSEPMRAFTAALAGWYKLAGVDLVREQIWANLGPAVTSCDIVPVGLVVSLSNKASSATYDLTDRALTSITPQEPLAAEAPAIDPLKVVFARVPLPWAEWVTCWEKDQGNGGNSGLPGLGEQLVCLPGIPSKTAPVDSQSTIDWPNSPTAEVVV